MKLIIAGGRDIDLPKAFIICLINMYKLNSVTEIICGGATGVDTAGEVFANNYELGLTKFPADWSKHGKAAGPIRNKQMAEYADTLLLIWDGKSKGSANMKKEMISLHKPIYEVILTK